MDFLLDDQDKCLIDQYSFSINGAGYYVARVQGKVQTLHSLILGKRPGLDIDHINGNKLDNRRSNLRHVTHQQNLLNTRLYKNNTSGYKGVTFHRGIGKWVAKIALNAEVVHLGSFARLEDAVMARKVGEQAYISPLFAAIEGGTPKK